MLKLAADTMVTPEVRLLEQVDRGLGGPVTWRALQTDWKKEVIVQFAPHGRLVDDALDGFLTAAALGQEVATSRVAHIHDFGVFEDRLPFVVVEALQGRTLEQRLKKQRRLPVAEVDELGKQLAVAVDGMHEVGVEHHRLGADAVVLRSGKEIDAVVRGLAIGLLTRVSKSDEYVSPEVYAGEEADNRADLWSLGAILYRMLLGRPAVEMAQRRAGQWQVTLPTVGVDKSLREALQPIFGKALHESPDERYGSAEAMVTALSNGLDSVRGADGQFRIVNVTDESIPPQIAEEDDDSLAW
ncbi:MAG: protein kinase [Myxococcales bacterium]|nr:protein kinase [Myxococcales bacterium]